MYIRLALMGRILGYKSQHLLTQNGTHISLRGQDCATKWELELEMGGLCEVMGHSPVVRLMT